MENKCKRFLSLLLALVMVLGVIPVGYVQATEEESAAVESTTIVAKAKVLGDGTRVPLEKCLYTFAKQEDGTWLISGDANGTTVYVDPYVSGNGGYPNRTYQTKVTLSNSTETDDKAVNFGDGTGYLHFWDNDDSKLWWDNCIGNDCTGHDLLLYRQIGEGEESSEEIPGYACISGIDDISDDGKYLIVGHAISGGYYAMRPSTDTGNDTARKNQVGMAIGEIQMNVNDTYTITVNGDHSDATGDEIVSVETSVKQNTVKQLVTTPATEIESGATYLIVNASAGKTMTNEASNVSAAAGTMNGRELEGTIENYADAALWTIKADDATANRYTIQDKDGKYLTVSENAANLVDEPATVNIEKNGETWVVGSGTTWLNNAANAGSTASGWNDAAARSGAGSQWKLYKFEDVPVYAVNPLAVTEIEDGDYLIYNRRSKKNLNNTGNNSGLLLDGAKAELTSTATWSVTAAGNTNSYYVKDENNKSLTIGSATASVQDAESAVSITWNNANNCWNVYNTVNNITYYLNHYGGGTSTKAAGDNGNVNDTGSLWDFFEITSDITTVTFTAKSADDTTLTVAGTPYYFHVHGYTGEVTKTPTFSETGVRTYTCSCGDSYTEDISVLTPKNAKPLMDDWRDNNRGAVSLSDCEYVLSGTEGAYSLCHNGTYYVNPSNSGGIPQQITPFAGLTLNIADGKVTISGGEKTLQVNNVQNKVDLESDNKYHPWWHDDATSQTDCTTDFYLLKANPDSTNTDIPGYEIVSEVADGESYLIAFKNGANEWFVMYPSTETVALAMVVESNGEFEISYSNMSMGNSLAMLFAVENGLVDNWEGYYAVIEKDYADDRGTATQIVEAEAWVMESIEGKTYRTISFKGVAAKEMTDEFRVVIYNPQGEPVSTVYTDTVAEYAQRSMKKNSSEENVTMVVDMLNYGAEAQKLAGYNMEHLANAGLTEEQKASATPDITLVNEMTCTAGFEYKANVKMVSNLQFMMAFSGINPDTMTAKVTFNKWDGEEKTVTFIGDDFVESGKFHYFIIEDTVVADGRQIITCEIFEGDEVICTVMDSIASYAARTGETNKSLYEAIMKFSDSARAYLTAKYPQNSESN